MYFSINVGQNWINLKGLEILSMTRSLPIGNEFAIKCYYWYIPM